MPTGEMVIEPERPGGHARVVVILTRDPSAVTREVALIDERLEAILAALTRCRFTPHSTTRRLATSPRAPPKSGKLSWHDVLHR